MTNPEQSLTVLFYTILFVSLEILVFMFLGKWLKKTFTKIYRFLFPLVVFSLFFIHILHFLLLQIMDTSFTYVFQAFLGNGIGGFFITLRSLNFSPLYLLLILAGITAFPIVATGIFYLTDRLSDKLCLRISKKTLMLLIGCFLCSILIMESALYYLAPTNDLFTKQNSLPFCKTFLPTITHTIPLPSSVPPIKDEKELTKQVSAIPKAKNKPNIYLFVTEALRKDFIDDETAPNLSLFRDSSLSFPLSLSNATASQISWFSIFHSQFSFYWSEQGKQWNEGSMPLKVLKQLGYKIHVITSAELTYHDMDKSIFGNDLSLIDDYKNFSQDGLPPCDRDRLTINALNSLVEENSNEGHLYCIFLDSTHSEYSWPKDFPTKFGPITPSIPYIQLTYSKVNVPQIKNRYRNAIHYIDHLFGEFVSKMQEQNKWDDSMVVFTGDHGEEFFEEGAIFHATHLNKYQTHVPLYYKIPESLMKDKNSWEPATITSHVDIFPTLIHILSDKEDWSTFFDGESIYNKNRRSFVIGVKQNGHQTPKEFFIQDKNHFMTGKFSKNFPSIFNSKEIEIDAKSHKKNLAERFSKAFQKILH